MRAQSGQSATPDIGLIRRRLEQDRYWSIYALGDLDPGRARFCEWFTSGNSVALLYREFDPPVLFAAGDPEVLEAVPDVDTCYLHVPEAFLAAAQRRFALDSTRLMLRMTLRPEDLVEPVRLADTEALDNRHETEIRELYADGREAGEEPDFFIPSQLRDGTFFGVREGGRLLAVGGTHVYSAAESVGAIGNVYAHRAHRQRGFGSAITIAIARRLIDRQTATIALNVKSGNTAAMRIYERLGFRFHTRFWEATARRR